MSRQTVYSDLYFIEEMLRCTIGQDPNIYVEPMAYIGDCTYQIKLCVRGQGRAESLRTILPRSYEQGQQTILTKVCLDGEEVVWTCMPQGNSRQVATLFCMALESNDYFIGAMLPAEKLLNLCSDITIWIRRGQVCLSPCSAPETIAQLFSQILNRHYGCLIRSTVWFKEYTRGCIKPGQLYCGCNRQ